jgi:lipid-binding SYLF domain-containing protein
VTLGGDASVAAGPVGRDASVDTDVLLKAGILSYSRSRGLFAGVSLKGAIVGPMKNLNETYYGEDATTDDILFSGKVKPTKAGKELINFLKKY